MKKILKQIIVIAGALFTLTATAQIQYSNEFWISTNATGNIYPTNGTLGSPLDGSTAANFDANMGSLPPNSTVHILAGTYDTMGDNAWIVKPGDKILGSGIDNTVLKLGYSNPTNSYFVHTIGSWFPSVGVQEEVSNVEVCDLTCDCNYGNGHTTPCGVSLDGTMNAIRRVKVIHGEYNGGGTSEDWGIQLIDSYLPASTGNVIEDCEVSEFAGGAGITAIAAIGVNAIIRDNVIILPADSSIDAFGINGSYVPGAVIEGNYVYGALNAIYSDTGGWTNTVIMHNRLQNCFNGVTIAPVNNPLENLKIAFNNIDLVATNNYNSIAFNFWGGVWTNIFIVGNTVDFYNTGPSDHSFLIAASDVTGLVFDHNFIDATLVSNQLTTAQFTNVINLTMDNNYDLFGNYLYDLNVPTLGGVAVSPFGLSLVNSAEASSALTNLGLPANPMTVITNNQTGVTLGGTFSGNGSGLTNLAATNIVGTISTASLPFFIRAGSTNLNMGGSVIFSTPVPTTNYAVSVSTSFIGPGGSGSPNILRITTNGFTVTNVPPSVTLYYIAVQKQ